MKKKKGVVVFLVMIIAMLLLGYYSYGIVKGTAAKDNDKGVKLGLDLAGGVSITYQVKGDETPSAEDMSDTVYKLQKRVETYSTEAEVYQVGDNRISVEIPGVSDANSILEELGTPGTLEFKTTEGETFMTGEMVADAQAATQSDTTTSGSKYVVQLKLNDEGAKIFSEKTGEYLNKVLPIYYDGECISYPTVQSQITNGEAVISGMSSYEDAEALASQIRSGALKLELEELQSEVVGAKLGSQAIKTSIIAAIIGILIIIAFMLIAYRIPGLAASIALLIYTGIILAILHLYHITLTLPGIAGIILSIGMAVDANVIIFARVREEMAKGKTVKSSLKAGFQKAMSAIVDGNVTTLIAAAVLWFKGSGTVKGFAQTLAIGIVVSMFTALVITRMIVYAFYGIGIRKESLYYHQMKERKPVNFLGKKKIFFSVSIALILAGFVIMGVNSAKGNGALAYSLDFQGGTSMNVKFDKDYSIDEIDEEIVPVVEKITGDHNIQTQKVSGTKQVIIKTKTLSLAKREQVNKALKTTFGVKESDITAENISSTISGEMRRDAVIAVIVATIFMLLYIWFRFKDVRFATSAVAALLHDVLVVLAFYAASRISVGTTFIACMLTIVGYSINATIVIFDRIREELPLMKRNDDLAEVVNKCITQTLTRSIYTSLTTFIMVFVLFIMGVSSIREFAAPLMAGIICGGYSSVCITGALWYVMKTKVSKKATNKKKK